MNRPSHAIFHNAYLLGLVSLAGIVINNEIVLIDRIAREEAAGKVQNEAVLVACLSRLRPILITTPTTALGLLVGTFLTLGVVLILYSLMIPDRTAWER